MVATVNPQVEPVASVLAMQLDEPNLWNPPQAAGCALAV